MKSLKEQKRGYLSKCIIRNFRGIIVRKLIINKMGIASKSSVLTYLSFTIKNLKNLRCANVLANQKS